MSPNGRGNGKQCRLEQSDLGLHCLPRPVRPKTYENYGISRNLK